MRVCFFPGSPYYYSATSRGAGSAATATASAYDRHWPPHPSPRGGNTDEGLRNGWIAPAWLTTNGPMRKITISIFTTLVKFKYSWIWQTALRHKLTVWNTGSSDNNWSEAFVTKHKLGPSYVGHQKRILSIESLTNHLYIQDTSAACLSAFSSRILWMNSF